MYGNRKLLLYQTHKLYGARKRCIPSSYILTTNKKKRNYNLCDTCEIFITSLF